MKRFCLFLLVAPVILLMANGCWDPFEPVLASYDLRATVKSHTDRRPYVGALVRVVQTDDQDYTDGNGQTDWLSTPKGATWCDVFVASTDYQITTTVRVGLSRDPNANQPVVYLAPKAPGINENVRMVNASTFELLDTNTNPIATFCLVLRPHSS